MKSKQPQTLLIKVKIYYINAKTRKTVLHLILGYEPVLSEL
jgi:hypothetical protein